MGLPYQTDYMNWRDIDLKTVSWKDIDKQTNDNILHAVMETARSSADYVGVCLLIGGAHGYEMQYEFIQLMDGNFLFQAWSDLSKGSPATSLVQLNIDLRKEIHNLQGDNSLTRKARNENIDSSTGEGGRYTTIYIVVGEDAEWIACQTPLEGGIYKNNAINRILCEMLHLQDSITLI
jgi:hypothetical protein